MKETGVDFLAASIGTVHGMYDGEPHIRLDLLEEIKEAIDIPLVLHGGSGTPIKQVLKSINRGIRKINVNTEVSLTAVEMINNTLQNNPKTHISVVMENAQQAMTAHMQDIMTAYKNN